MKLALPLAVLAALLGFAVGRVTAPTPRAPTTPSHEPERRDAPVAATHDSASKPPTSEPRPSGPVAPSTPALSPRMRIIRNLNPVIDEQAQWSNLWLLARKDPATARRAWEFLRKATDPEELDLYADLLCSCKDDALMAEILAAFETESDPARRAAIAHAIGGNWRRPEVAAVGLRLLQGDDERIKTKLLSRFSLQDFAGRGEVEEPDVADIRVLLQQMARNGTEDARAAAVKSLRGAWRAQNVEFLIEAMMKDPSPKVQLQAMWSLPLNYMGGPETPLAKDQVRAACALALDPARDPNVRRKCADRALQMASFVRSLPTLLDAEREALQRIRDGKE